YVALQSFLQPAESFRIMDAGLDHIISSLCVWLLQPCPPVAFVEIDLVDTDYCPDALILRCHEYLVQQHHVRVRRSCRDNSDDLVDVRDCRPHKYAASFLYFLYVALFPGRVGNTEYHPVTC